MTHFLKSRIDHVEPYGTATVGSSEACTLAVLAHKWNRQQARENAGKGATRPEFSALKSARARSHAFQCTSGISA